MDNTDIETEAVVVEKPARKKWTRRSKKEDVVQVPDTEFVVSKDEIAEIAADAEPEVSVSEQESKEPEVKKPKKKKPSEADLIRWRRLGRF